MKRPHNKDLQVIVILDEDPAFAAVERPRRSKAAHLFVPEPAPLPSLFVCDTFHQTRISTRYTKERKQYEEEQWVINCQQPQRL